MEVSNKVEHNLNKLQKACEEKLMKLEKILDLVHEKERILHHLNGVPAKQVELSNLVLESANIQLELGTTHSFVYLLYMNNLSFCSKSK